MRQKIVAGNWKMNNDLAQTEDLITALKKQYQTSDAEVMIAPAHTNLWQTFQTLRNSDIEVIAQNMHYADSGAYTGEVSPPMLKSIGVNTVILGHSERRSYFHETDELLSKKVNAALKHKMRVIFCFGEELNDRKAGNHESIVKSQIENALGHLSKDDFDNIILAYEPVWAIGTGETATPEQAQEMHAFIRSVLSENFDKELADQTSILYGGSVKPSNAKDLFSKQDVDGGLIGGASLNADDFFAIVNAF